MRSLRADHPGDGTYAASSSIGTPLTVQTVAGNTFESHSMVWGATNLTAGDFNGDGKPDLVTPNTLLIGNGGGTFQSPVVYRASYDGSSVAVGDFDGDGNLDVAVGTMNGLVGVQLGNGDGTFRASVNYDPGIGTHAANVATADFNGDGKSDLVVGGDNGFSVLIGNGDGTFQPAMLNGTTRGLWFVAVGDFNGDGKPDLVTANGSVSILLGNGDGRTSVARSPTPLAATR